MTLVKLDKKDLPQIIENIERNGGDASELRNILGVSPSEQNTIDDDEWVELKMKQSEIHHGSGLRCTVCGELVNDLISGVCEQCFGAWALTARRE